MKIALKIIISIFSISYPFALIFFKDYSSFVLIIMAFLWAGRGILESKEKENFSNTKFSFFLALFFILAFVLQGWGLKYLYPVLINTFLALVFYLSLKKTPIITKLAMLKDKNLPLKAINYTANLTKIWLGFFIINGLVSAILALRDNKIYWLIYCGIISYFLIGILILGELIFRKFYIKNA